MKKIFCFLILCFIVAGCQASYELKINDDLTVNETIIGLENEEFYELFRSPKSNVIDMVLAPYRDYIKTFSYRYSEVVDSEMYGAKIEKKYSSLQDFGDKFSFYIPYFEDFKLDVSDDGKVHLSLSNKIINDSFSNRYIIDKGTISIIVPFKVISHNADSYDAALSKYTWNFDLTDKTKSNIDIVFDTKYVEENNLILIVLLSSFILLIITFIIIFLIFKKKNKNCNDI